MRRTEVTFPPNPRSPLPVSRSRDQCAGLGSTEEVSIEISASHLQDINDKGEVFS